MAIIPSSTKKKHIALASANETEAVTLDDPRDIVLLREIHRNSHNFGGDQSKPPYKENLLFGDIQAVWDRKARKGVSSCKKQNYGANRMLNCSIDLIATFQYFTDFQDPMLCMEPTQKLFSHGHGALHGRLVWRTSMQAAVAQFEG